MWALWMVAIGQSSPSAEPWRIVEQPGLMAALDNAPLLQTKSLGQPARGVNTWEHWAVPNPDGKTWDELQIYFKEYYGPTWLYAIDLGTGEVNKQRLPDNRQFYLSGRALGLDGKYYIATPDRSRGWDMVMHVYAPGAGSSSMPSRSVRTRRRIDQRASVFASSVAWPPV